jgi:integrase
VDGIAFARYLTADELEKLIKAGRKGRYGRRDATLMLLIARHGLRVTEAIDLRWDQIDFSKGHLHVRRLKGGIHSVHPIQGDELRALRELRREQEPEAECVARTNLEYIPEIGLGGVTYFGKLPSEELFRRIDADNPSNPSAKPFKDF